MDNTIFHEFETNRQYTADRLDGISSGAVSYTHLKIIVNAISRFTMNSVVINSVK